MAIATAYARGSYTMQQLGDHSGEFPEIRRSAFLVARPAHMDLNGP
jgi:hypothetical protein